MSEPLIVREELGPVVRLTLNHPTRRNALSRAMLAALRDEFASLAERRDVKCVVLAASGQVFSSGHDLAELVAAPPEELRAIFALCTEVMESIRLGPQITIAQVQGLATAAGCQLVATCDLVVAAPLASFATPGVKIGLFCSTPAVALARAVPTKRALEMLLTGEPLAAAQAQAVGLVNRVVPQAELAVATLALARQIAGAFMSRLADLLGKRRRLPWLGRLPARAARPCAWANAHFTSRPVSRRRRPTSAPARQWSKMPNYPMQPKG